MPKSPLKHRYQIQLAKSKDGLVWRKYKLHGLSLSDNENSQSRPCIIKYDNKYHMWYSSKITKSKKPACKGKRVLEVVGFARINGCKSVNESGLKLIIFLLLETPN